MARSDILSNNGRVLGVTRRTTRRVIPTFFEPKDHRFAIDFVVSPTNIADIKYVWTDNDRNFRQVLGHYF